MNVADTGPINYLVLVGEEALLPFLFQIVSVSEQVQRGLDHPETPIAVRQWMASAPGWLRVHPDEPERPGLESLDAGERASIRLAQALGPHLILMDDRAAVKTARSLGFRVIGTIGVLDLAAGRGLVDLADAFARLRHTNFHVSLTLLDDLLARHKT